MAATRAPATVQGRKVRFAVVGCGRISAKHFEALKQHDQEQEKARKHLDHGEQIVEHNARL